MFFFNHATILPDNMYVAFVLLYCVLCTWVVKWKDVTIRTIPCSEIHCSLYVKFAAINKALLQIVG